MNTCQISVLAVFVAAPLAFGAPPPAVGPEGLSSQLPLVTLTAAQSAPPVRVDVRSLCPDIDMELQNSLSSAWGRVQKTGS